MKNISVTLTDEVLKKYKKDHCIFVETGTYLGGAVSMAIEQGFDLIYSVDISYNKRNQEYFKKEIQLLKVKLLYGDSVDILPSVIREINGVSSMFWLDAHYDVFSNMCGKYKTPILQELECISKSRLNNHTILIDDIRMFRNSEEWAVSVTLDQIISTLIEINPMYKIVYENGRDDDSFRKDDILVAYI